MRRRTLADHQLDDVRVGQAFPGGEGVLDVVFKPVIRPQDRGDAALGLAGGGLRQALFGYQVDPWQTPPPSRHNPIPPALSRLPEYLRCVPSY